MRRKELICFLVLLILTLQIHAQQDIAPRVAEQVTEELAAGAEDRRERLLLAVSSEDYPVTPGDTYRLTFRTSGVTVSNEVVVGSDYILNLNIFGRIDGRGKSFVRIKAEVEDIIAKAYASSMPSLNLTVVGMFQVLLSGEIPETQYITAWGLSRLSEVLDGNLSSYSSIRDVTVRSRDYATHTYDLFKAARFGTIQENPYIRPGDTIQINRNDRIIEVKGEVYRPGRYQLLNSENARDLLSVFCGGFTGLADPVRVKRERISGGSPQTVYLDLSQGISTDILLRSGDIITVMSQEMNLPVVFLEGSLLPVAEAEVAAVEAPGVPAPQEYIRITRTFIPGETLFGLVSPLRDSISPGADLSRCTLIRRSETEPIPFNLESLLFSYTREADISLEPFDRIVIPSRWYFVNVTGNVGNPGTYPFAPQRRYSYYVGLAGGYVPESTISESIVVTDENGNTRDPRGVILPEDTIHVSAPQVSVSGAVFGPGNFPFTPGRTYTYYVGLAGGIDLERNTNNRVTITDSEGREKPSGSTIQPGDRIYVQNNNFVYNFNRYFPIVTTGIAFVITIITIIDLIVN